MRCCVYAARAAELLCGLVAATEVPPGTVGEIIVPGPNVVCHVNYGGEDRTITAPPVSSPYGVKGEEVGSYFLFRVVNQTQPADLASVKVYTYADHEAGAALIHQAQYTPAQVARRPAKGDHGFTGQHWVYEPVRDGELKYWCELASHPRSLRQPHRQPHGTNRPAP